MELEEIQRVYFIGIGGIGMSAIARYFNHEGKEVAGYDLTSTDLTNQLKEEGIEVHFDESVESIPNSFTDATNKSNTLIVYTPAVSKDNLIYKYFESNGFDIEKRAPILGRITNSETTLIAVSGTHGKTTISSMIAHVIAHSNVDCTAFLGGIMNNYNSNFMYHSKPKFMVVEADEFDRSFLHLNPDVAVITSMDNEHMDVYKDSEQLKQSFNQFVKRINKKGELILKHGLSVNTSGINHTYYSLDSGSDISISNFEINEGKFKFDYLDGKDQIENIELSIEGKHNIENSIAAISVCRRIGLSDDSIKEGIQSFAGVKRRFEFHVRNDETVYIDDYAHHPEEVKTCINSVRELFPGKKVTGIFQPHLFSRTRDFMEEFANSLSLLDELILLEIYPAREIPIDGVTSETLASLVKIESKNVFQKENLVQELSKMDLEILITMGAGDISNMIVSIKEMLINKMSS